MILYKTRPGDSRYLLLGLEMTPYEFRCAAASLDGQPSRRY